jgi:crotonobetainyl-CoA:carnitine CoA-transferase CaiB-like acyl-CoA transferase
MAAMLLADFGAEVLTLEPPGGSPDRERPGFALWNRGKASVTLDPESADGRRDMLSLLHRADVCVATPGGSAEWAGDGAGIGAVAMAGNPRLVYLDVTPYLDTTPWAGGAESSSLLAAATGSALRQSSGDGGPVDPVYPHLLYIQAIWAACCAVAALIERANSGLGQIVTVGGVHGAMAASPLQMVVRPGEPDPDTAVGPGGHSPTYTRYRCADGRWLFLAALTPKFQAIALRVLGFSDLLERGAAAGFDAVVGPAHRAEVRPRFEAEFATRTCAEWQAAFAAAGCPVAPLAEREGWLDHPQVQAIRMAVAVDDPDRGMLTMPGNPIVLGKTPAMPPGPAPRLRAVGSGLPSWPLAAPERAATARAAMAPAEGRPAGGNGPLAGLRVLDAGVVLAGPYAGTLLAELGADVVKVEIPDGDSFRRNGFPYIRGQRGLALDLQSQQGRGIFRRLARSCDIVIENYRPGVAERLGITYEELRLVKPDIITLSISAFGDSGPMQADAGFDTVLQAMSGIMTAQGGTAEPVMLTLAVNDTAAAILTALAACIAVLHRQRGGGGQRGSVSLAAASVLMQCEELIRMDGRLPPVAGGADFRGPGPADRFYRAADGWIRVQATTNAAATALAELADCADGEKDGERTAALATFFAGLPAERACALLAAAGIPATTARRSSDLPGDPQLARWQVQQLMSSGGGPELFAAGRMAAFARTQRTGCLIPPGVGEHSWHVLRESGLDDQAIAALIEDDIVRAGPAMTIAAVAPYR